MVLVNFIITVTNVIFLTLHSELTIAAKLTCYRHDRCWDFH